MLKASKNRFVVPLLASLAVVALATPRPNTPAASFNRSHLRASLTRLPKIQSQRVDTETSVAYVVAGSGLMSLGLLFGHTRQRSYQSRTSTKN